MQPCEPIQALIRCVRETTTLNHEGCIREAQNRNDEPKPEMGHARRGARVWIGLSLRRPPVRDTEEHDSVRRLRRRLRRRGWADGVVLLLAVQPCVRACPDLHPRGRPGAARNRREDRVRHRRDDGGVRAPLPRRLRHPVAGPYGQQRHPRPHGPGPHRDRRAGERSGPASGSSHRDLGHGRGARTDLEADRRELAVRRRRRRAHARLGRGRHADRRRHRRRHRGDSQQQPGRHPTASWRSASAARRSAASS